MIKTTRLLTTVATLGALAAASISYAAPAEQKGEPETTSSATKAFSIKDMMDARFEGLARMLTLEEGQKAAWNNYVTASKALHLGPQKTWDKPAVDTQDRLERRVQMAEARTKLLKDFTDARAALLKVLNPPQKLVLEQVEATHGRMGGMSGMGGGMGMHGKKTPVDPHHGKMPNDAHHQQM